MSKASANNVIKQAMLAFGISKTTRTDPLLIQDILQNLEISDFKTTHAPMNAFFKRATSDPQDLEPMFNSIQQGLSTKHPAIIEFLEIALKRNWLQSTSQVTRSIHIAYVLEAMTSAMCNNHTFLIEVENHYRSKTRLLGLDNLHISQSMFNAWRRFHDFFKVAKLSSLDPIMIFFRLQRGLGDALFTKKELDEIYKKKEINYFEYKLLYKLCKKCSEPANTLVRLNIYEAGTTEYRNGFHANAVSAHVLSEDLKTHSPSAKFTVKQVVPEKDVNPFYKTLTTEGSSFLDIDETQDWVSLYITWNMAFILGNLENLDLLFPKLFIPSIINAEHTNFLGVRVISLWLSINHFLFRDARKTEMTGPSQKKEMAKVWGKINKKYALQLAKRKSNQDPRTVMDGYTQFFAHPFRRLLLLIKKFFKKTCK